VAQQQKQEVIPEKLKKKPNQIMVLHRDEQTNELIKTLVDKKKKVRVTKLKKAIREQRTKDREVRKAARPLQHKGEDSAFETVYETDYQLE